MKKKQIIGIAIASLGAALCVSSAAALYVTGAVNVQFGIGQGEFVGSAGVVTYKINDAVDGTIAPQYWNSDGSDKTGEGLSATYTQVVYEGVLSANFANGVNPQDFVLGDLSVSVSNIPEAYRGHLGIWVDVDGYVADSLGKATYEHVFMNSDYQITDEVHSYTDSKTIAVSSSGVQKVRVMLKYNLEAYDQLAKNEETLGYTVSIQWGAPSVEFEAAYVVGNGNQWTMDDEYMMAPNINKANAEGWEWVYNNLPGSMLSAKCEKANGENPFYSAGDDAVLDAEKSYNVYWNGNAEGVANFAAIVVNP